MTKFGWMIGSDAKYSTSERSPDTLLDTRLFEYERYRMGAQTGNAVESGITNHAGTDSVGPD